MALFSQRTWNEWRDDYSAAHQHPLNQYCHVAGIPMIALGIILLPAMWLWYEAWVVSVFMLLAGGFFMIVGDVYEKRLPQTIQNWRFFVVSFYWWATEI